VSVTVRMNPAVKAAIAAINEEAWTMIEYIDTIRDGTTGQWISKTEVAEIGFTAFRSRKNTERVAGRLIVRRIPDLNPRNLEQPTLSTASGITRSSPRGSHPRRSSRTHRTQGHRWVEAKGRLQRQVRVELPGCKRSRRAGRPERGLRVAARRYRLTRLAEN